MTDRALTPRTVTIVGRPDEVVRAMNAQVAARRLLTHPSHIPMRHLPDGRIEIRPALLVDAPPARRRPDDTFRQIMYALLWVGGLFLISALMVALIVYVLWETAGPLVLLGALVTFGGLILTVAFNRTNHSGACPGIVVHCAGCRD